MSNTYLNTCVCVYIYIYIFCTIFCISYDILHIALSDFYISYCFVGPPAAGCLAVHLVGHEPPGGGFSAGRFSIV